MSERNIINGVAAVVSSTFADAVYPLRWMLLLGAVLIVVDLRFGVRAARVRGEPIRRSRAVRRTINKMVDYLCWIFLAKTLDMVFGEPFGTTMIPALIMLVIYGVEINSCFSNYFESRGLRFSVDIFEWFGKRSDIIKIDKIEDKDETLHN